MVDPASAVIDGTPDFFGTEADIASARTVHDSADATAAQRATAGLCLAWWLRQRDTRLALEHADATEASIGALPADRQSQACGRIALVRAEAAFLYHRLADAQAQIALAREALQRDPTGLGDADLMHATVLDHQGGDRLSALADAQTQFRRAGHAVRLRLANTWIACIDATADPQQLQDKWGAALDDAAQTGGAGLATFVEGARGTAAWRSGDPAAAIACFQRGFDAALASGQLQSAVTLAQNTGIAFSILNDHQGALEWADRARAIAEPTGWVYVIGWCLMQTGSILVGLGRAQAALDLLLPRMSLFDDAQASRNHIIACQILGEACLELRDNEAALHWSTRALESTQESSFPDLLDGTLRYLALAQSRLGQVDAALATAQRALALAEAQEDWPRVATIHHVLAEVARDHGLPVPAGSEAASAVIHHLRAAIDSGARMPGFSIPPEWLEELSAAQQAAGQLAAALASERRASQARQAVQAKRSDELATAMLVRHRTAQAEAEAQRQRALAEASELRAELVASQGALEQERLQRMLVHAGKLAAVGRLAAGVVHEMSHPVGTVALLAETLQAQLADASDASPALRDGVHTLVGESRRLQHFITRLRDFARAEPLQIEDHDLQAVLADARQLFEPRLVVERVELHLEAPSVTVPVDPQRLALAVANLVFNAADALAGRAAPRIDVTAIVEPRQVRLHVDDNGPGLSDEVRSRLFEPFFTTRPQGLGLGLVLSAESLAAMGGRLLAGRSASGGARFTIELPRGD